MAVILVVDDEQDLEVLIKQKFRKKIREGILHFSFVNSGEAALQWFAANGEPDLMLCDIRMSGMDGLTLLKKINSQSHLVRTVMISAFDDMENIRSAMNHGAFDFLVKPIDFDDLAITIDKVLDTVAQTKQTLQALRENNILKMYVDPAVIQFMGSDRFENTITANEVVDATVMFVDICGFTGISEVASPDQVITMLNNYFDIMCGAVLEYDGHIDKFIGDAIMAVFRGDFHADRALDASLDLSARIKKQPSLEDPIHFDPRVSIGINTGSVIAGNTGSIALKRLDFTVVGDTVNVAQRLQALAQAGQILVSKAVYDKARESFAFKELGERALKNKAHAVQTYELLA